MGEPDREVGEQSRRVHSLVGAATARGRCVKSRCGTAGERGERAVPVAAADGPAVGDHVERPGRGSRRDDANDLRGVVHVDQVQPAFGIGGDRRSCPEVGDPRQPAGAVEPGEPQRHAGPLGVSPEERLGLQQHLPRLAGRVGGRRFAHHAAVLVAPHARRTREDDAGRARQGGEQAGEADDMDVAVRRARGPVEAHSPEDRGRFGQRESRGKAGIRDVGHERLQAEPRELVRPLRSAGHGHDAVTRGQPAGGDPRPQVAAAHDEPRGRFRRGGCWARRGHPSSGWAADSASPCRWASIHDASTTWAATASARAFFRPRDRPTPASMPAASRELYRSS